METGDAVAMRIESLAAEVALQVEAGATGVAAGRAEASARSPVKLRAMEKQQYRAAFKWRKSMGIRATPSMDAPLARAADGSVKRLKPMEAHERIFVDECVTTVCHFAQEGDGAEAMGSSARASAAVDATPAANAAAAEGAHPAEDPAEGASSRTFEVRWLRLSRPEGYTAAGDGGWVFDISPVTGVKMFCLAPPTDLDRP